MFNVGPAEILVILLLALVVFGPKRLPEIGKTVGKGLAEFRKATQDIKDEVSRTMDDGEDEAEQATPLPVDQATSPNGSAPTTPVAGSGTGDPKNVSGEAAPGA
jgi:sec-independent protein translocase protein TatA